MFWKIYFLYEFWCAQSCSFRAVFGLPIRTLTLLLPALYSNVNVRKKFYISALHIYILHPKLLLWNFLQISQLSIRSGVHKRFRRFLVIFAIFDRNFANIVAPSGSDQNENCVALLKERSLLKNCIKIDP